MQPISRRSILTLAGSGLAGAGAAQAIRPAAADSAPAPRIAIERGYRPLALRVEGSARIQHTDAAGSSGAQVEAALDRRSILEDRELVIQVRAAVANDLVGRRRVLRTMIFGDNSDL